MTPKEKAEKMAIFFHDTYEELAPSFGYKTKDETKIFEKDSPNGKLMIAVCEKWLLKQEIEKL